MKSKFFSIVFGILFAILLLEVVLRIFYFVFLSHDIEFARYALKFKEDSSNQNIRFVHKSGLSARIMGVRVETNSDGFRDRDYPVSKDKGVYRILTIGDSLTFGWGVPRKSTYAEQLEARFNGAVPKYEVINLGHGNYNTYQEVNLLEERGMKYDPDLIIMGFYINDAEEIKESKYAWVAHSFFLTTLWGKIDVLKRRLNSRERYDSYYKGLYEEDGEGLAYFKRAFKQLSELSKDRGFDPK